MTKTCKLVIPQPIDLFDPENEQIKNLKFIDPKIPKYIPNINYRVFKVEGKTKENVLRIGDGAINFRLRYLDEKTYGYALCTNSINAWHVTNVIRSIKDRKHYFEVKTYSGSTYLIEPSRVTKDKYLKLRTIK